MSKSPGRPSKPVKTNAIVKVSSGTTVPFAGFDDVLLLIQATRLQTVAAVNTALIDLYWSIGQHISQKVDQEGWGTGTVSALADYIRTRIPNARGFSASNLWRMKQFFDTYRELPKLAPLVRELSWTHNLIIMGRSKRDEEREFYLKMALQERWSKRQLERQVSGALFERVVLSPAKLAPPVRELHPDAASVFKDSYLVEFLDLPKEHSEADLHDSLVEHLKDFLIELGRDFCFVGSHYPIQVGGDDFEIDLLFFHRGLNCLVDIELKIDHFKPEYLGKLNFYLEALDRDVKKPHENPAIGLLLCATKNEEVVEYALSRSASPTVIAEYQTRLPDKKLLLHKLHEFYTLAAQGSEQMQVSHPKSHNSSKQTSRRRKSSTTPPRNPKKGR
jgi:predicted nuclease of restriction endonuclease-like (RecB) superfamily